MDAWWHANGRSYGVRQHARRSVFSAERLGGARTFLVATPGEFWRRCCDALPQHRHFYEIIRHAAPCHLYFGAP